MTRAVIIVLIFTVMAEVCGKSFVSLSLEVESVLKVFVYPIPKSAKRCNMKLGGFDNSYLKPMFDMERRVPDYFRKSVMATSDPSKAHMFIIDHEWLCLRIGNGATYNRLSASEKLSWQKEFVPENAMPRDTHHHDKKHMFNGDTIGKYHLAPIFHSIVHDYPYFNLSGGSDHFTTFVLDNGPFCGGGHVMPWSPHVLPILRYLDNVSIIGNFGFNSYESTNWNKHTEPKYAELLKSEFKSCYRVDQDITIPQAHNFQLMQHSYLDFNAAAAGGNDTSELASIFDNVAIDNTGFTDWLLKFSRPGDAFYVGSTFAGKECSPNVRPDLVNVLKSSPLHSAGAPVVYWGDKYKSMFSAHFALCPAGQACWSMRLYDALFKDTVPVILANGIVEPFERFIDWRKISIKYNSSVTSEDHRDLAHLFQNLHNFTQEFRSSAHDRSSSLIAQKLAAIKKVLPWLTFDPPSISPCNASQLASSHNISYQQCHTMSAYKLLTLEMWCRMKSTRHEVCSRPSSIIAHKTYD